MEIIYFVENILKIFYLICYVIANFSQKLTTYFKIFAIDLIWFICFYFPPFPSNQRVLLWLRSIKVYARNFEYNIDDIHPRHPTLYHILPQSFNLHHKNFVNCFAIRFEKLKCFTLSFIGVFNLKFLWVILLHLQRSWGDGRERERVYNKYCLLQFWEFRQTQTFLFCNHF